MCVWGRGGGAAVGAAGLSQLWVPTSLQEPEDSKFETSLLHE